MRIPPVIRIYIMNLTTEDGKTVPIDRAETERTFSGSCSAYCSSYLYRDNVMSGILVPFVKQIVRHFVFQTEVLDEFPL